MVYAIGLASRYLDKDDEEVRIAPDPGLRKLAAETGGGYFELTRSRDLSSAFTRVLKELHNQYALAFVPATLDGRVHKLTLSVVGAQLSVRARRSYVATRASGAAHR